MIGESLFQELAGLLSKLPQYGVLADVANMSLEDLLGTYRFLLSRAREQDARCGDRAGAFS